MHLAVISTVRGCEWAGSETVWHLVALRALREGHSVTAIIHPDISGSRQIKSFTTQGGRTRQWNSLPIQRLQSLKERVLPTFPVRLLRGFDAVLVSLGSLPSICYVPGLASALIRSRVPFVLFCQFNADHLAITPDQRGLVREVIRKSAGTVFLSQRNLQEARRQFAVEPPAPRVVGNPVRDGVREIAPWPVDDSVIRFASVARFETAWKAQDLLLDVLQRPTWRERPWHLTFYGSGPDYTHVEQLARFFEIEDRVTFAGFVADLREIWRNNHVLLLPSHGEGLPLAALEAMMLGRPVVATDVGGNRELIADGVNGFIADGATAHSFNDALERSWRSRDTWCLMGHQAHAKALEVVASDPTKQLLDGWLGVANPCALTRDLRT